MKKNTNEAKKETKVTLNWIDDKFAIDRVNNFSDNCTFFNLYVKTGIGNVAIYGAKVVSTSEGNDFIAMPSRKNGDQFYPECSIRFDDGIESRIIEEVGKLI